MTEPQYQPTLQKPDLVDPLQKSLTSKVDELLKRCNIEKVETIKKTSVNEVRKNVALRCNKNKQNSLDRRSKSPVKYKEKGFIKDTKTTVKKNLTAERREYVEMYHNQQHNLFKKMSSRFPALFGRVQQKEDRKGFLYDNKGTQFTTTKFVNFIDKITIEFIEELKNLNVKILTPTAIKEKEHDVEPIAESCLEIVMLRYLVDMVIDTDLMKSKETERWRNHVSVILSFSALLVVLGMFKLKLRPKKSKKRSSIFLLPFSFFFLFLYSVPIDFISFCSFGTITLMLLILHGFSLHVAYILLLLLLWALNYITSALLRMYTAL